MTAPTRSLPSDGSEVEPSQVDASLARWKAKASSVFSVLVWLVLGIFVVVLAVGDYQWDFYVFHAAPRALDLGINPYGMPSPIPGIPHGWCYLYPPVLLYVFAPLGIVSVKTAMVLWLVAKLAALACLLRLWHRHFEPLSFAWPTVLFLVLGFNAAILLDFTAGNMATFEALGLWAAFLLILQGRPYVAGLIIAVFAQFKVAPVLFLALLPFVGPARSWKAFFTSAAVFAGLMALNPLLLPEMTSQFLASFSAVNPNMDETGQINPSTLSFMRNIVNIGTARGVPLPRSLADLSYLLVVALLAAGALWLLVKHADRVRRADQRWLIYLACVLFALVAPRMKDYSYMLLLVPALHVVRHAGAAALVPLVGVMTVLPGDSTYLPAAKVIIPELRSYLSWFTAWVLLFFLVREIWAGRARALPQEGRA
jgi:hypothetical protein